MVGVKNTKLDYMKYEVFIEVIRLLKEQQAQIDKAYDSGIDLINFSDSIWSAVSHLIGSAYGKEGLETFQWWCHEKEWGSRTELTMTSADGNLLCETELDLYNYLEENKDDDYSLPKKLTQEERIEMLKQMFG